MNDVGTIKKKKPIGITSPAHAPPQGMVDDPSGLVVVCGTEDFLLSIFFEIRHKYVSMYFIHNEPVANLATLEMDFNPNP